jgi:hypothetical protein
MEYIPPTETLPIFDSTVFGNRNTSLTIDEASKYFLEFPRAQGPETLQATNIGGALVCSSTASFGTAGSPANIPTCIADYTTILPVDSSTKIPTTAWVQSAISGGGGSNVLSIQKFISNANITLPVGTQFVTLMVSGAGGASGGYYYDSANQTTTAGGGGGAGGCAIISRLPMEAGTNLIVAFSNNNGTCSVGYLSRPNTVYTFNVPLLTANAGAGGVTAVSTGGNPAGGAGGTVSVSFSPMGYGLEGGAGGAGQQSDTTYAIAQGINLLSTVNQNMVISTTTTPFNYGAGGYTRINDGANGNATINDPGQAVCIVISYSS